MRPIPAVLVALALLVLVPATSAAAPRFTLLASDGTGYAVEATETPGTFALSDDAGSAVVENRIPDDPRRAMRVGATARCMPGGARLLRVYGMVSGEVRRVTARTESGMLFALHRAAAPAGWNTSDRAIGRVVEIADSRLRIVARNRAGKAISVVTVTFSQTCAAVGARALAATLVPPTVDLDTTSMTARLQIPARPTAASYAINLVQPGWEPGRGAFSGDPWGSPLGPDGDAVLEGPGTIEGVSPALAQVGDVCLRGSARVVNTVIVRLPAGEGTTLAWPLELAPEPQWDTTRLQAAFRVRRDDYGATVQSNTAAFEGPLGVRFDLKARRRGSRAKVTGATSPPLRDRRVTLYVLKARPRERGAQLIANDFRPSRTLRVRTNSRGRFAARIEVERNAYRFVAEATDTPRDRIDDRSCPLERDWR